MNTKNIEQLRKLLNRDFSLDEEEMKVEQNQVNDEYRLDLLTIVPGFHSDPTSLTPIPPKRVM